MALVEPRQGDEIISVDGIDFAIGTREQSLMEMNGGLIIRFNKEGFWPGFRISANIENACC